MHGTHLHGFLWDQVFWMRPEHVFLDLFFFFFSYTHSTQKFPAWCQTLTTAVTQATAVTVLDP